MKTILQRVMPLFLLTIILSQTSCKKENETKSETTVNVTVTNATGVAQSNFTVYQIDDNKYNLYGTDPFFKDQQSVTDANGTATFKIDKIYFNTGGQRTYYFFCKYTLGGVNKTKQVGTTLSQGESKTLTLQLN